jgi:hypothetical protein
MAQDACQTTPDKVGLAAEVTHVLAQILRAQVIF